MHKEDEMLTRLTANRCSRCSRLTNVLCFDCLLALMGPQRVETHEEPCSVCPDGHSK